MGFVITFAVCVAVAAYIAISYRENKREDEFIQKYGEGYFKKKKK